MENNIFTIRVYGILRNTINEVLLVHEKMPNLSFTKFPGGGLEFGEGTIDCLIREFKEETDAVIEVVNHLYTTDFYQPSALGSAKQLLAIYYEVRLVNPAFKISLEEKTVMVNGKKEFLKFFWQNLENFDETLLTFPVDKFVARKFLIQ